MTARDNSQNEHAEQAVVITRVLDAPRDLVFKAWTEPDWLMRWWGPKGFTSPVWKIDLRLGGGYFNCMRSPDGRDYWSKGVFLEIAAPERLVMTDSFADEEGNTVSASHYGMTGDWPQEMLVTVTFEDYEGKTKLFLRHSGISGISATDRANMEQGWTESIEKLVELLESFRGENTATRTILIAEPRKQEIIVTHAFDAPRELVFKAFTDPSLIPLWWGPRYLTTTVDKMEVKRGGIWRFVQRASDGKEYAFNGVYHEIYPPERLVYTHEFEGMPGHISLETGIFVESEGVTKFTGKSVFQTVEDRDAMLESGMQDGLAETMDRLAELLMKLSEQSADKQAPMSDVPLGGKEPVADRTTEIPRQVR